MARPSEVIRFGEWLPDLPDLDNPGMVVVKNALPTAVGYTEVLGPEYLGGVLDGRPLAAHWTIAGGGTETAIFVATAESIYRQRGVSQAFEAYDWEDLSKSGGYSSSIDRWDMTSFGSRIIAVSRIDPTQFYDVPSGFGVRFADLPNAPKAGTIGVVRDFVVMGNIPDLGENYIQWSGFNNSEAWTPSRATQSDFQPLESGSGKVQKIISGSDGYIFLEGTIYRMTYIGPPRIFQLDQIAPGRGTRAPKSIVRFGHLIYFYEHSGFVELDTRSGRIRPIGQNKVDRWFRNNVPETCAVDMQATIDPSTNNILWAFCTDPPSTEYNTILLYNYRLDRWSMISVPLTLAALLPSPSASLDDLSSIFLQGIDLESINVDSDLFAGGALVMNVFSSSYQIGTMSGSPLSASFITAEYGTRMNNRTSTKRQRPYMTILPGQTMAQLCIARRDALSRQQEPTTFSPMNDSGQTFAKAKARFLQYHLEVSGGFDDVLGLEVFSRVG